MAGQIKANQIQLGDDAVASRNFVWQTNIDGTAKLARGNVGATTQDILTVGVDGVIKYPQLPYTVAAWNGSIAAQSTATTVPITLTALNNNFTLNANRLVVPVTGVYSITYAITFDATSDAQISQLYVNGIAVDGQQAFSASGFASKPRATCLQSLTAGDLVDVRGIRGSTACNMTAGYLTMHLVAKA